MVSVWKVTTQIAQIMSKHAYKDFCNLIVSLQRYAVFAGS